MYDDMARRAVGGITEESLLEWSERDKPEGGLWIAQVRFLLTDQTYFIIRDDRFLEIIFFQYQWHAKSVPC